MTGDGLQMLMIQTNRYQERWGELMLSASFQLRTNGLVVNTNTKEGTDARQSAPSSNS
jgi:hypothetical protein